MLYTQMHDTLENLYLQYMYNCIGIDGTSSFAEMLIKNRSLKLLDLHSDTIGGKLGTEILIESLQQNTTLERLIIPTLHVLDIKNSGMIVDSRVTAALDDPIEFGKASLMYILQ